MFFSCIIEFDRDCLDLGYDTLAMLSNAKKIHYLTFFKGVKLGNILQTICVTLEGQISL
jgi:hypothetical protein